ncbi:MAG: hypothetical protein CO113_15925, partial [Elusimicrobia bacterium CG_4_9_14_3_um_filter_62_55]
MSLRERIAKALFGEPDITAGSGGGIHHVQGLSAEEAAAAKDLLGALRGEVEKQGKGVQPHTTFGLSDRHGILPPIDFTVFDQMFEQTSWVRAVVGVITKAVTAKGWGLRPLSPDADPKNAETLREFFANPNPQDTFVEILDDITRDSFVFGNAFTEVVRGLGGKPREMWTLDAPSMRVRIDPHGLILGYVQVPAVALGGKSDVAFEPREVMHNKLGTKGSALYGLSPLASLILPVTVDKFAQIYNRAFFLNGAKIRGAYVMKDATPEQVERNREFLKARAKDMNLAQADLVLEGPVEFKQIGTTQKDMEFLSLREFTRNEILAVYGVPPAMVSIIETGNIGAGTGDTQRQNFYEETVAPFQRRVAEKITQQIINNGFGITDWAFEFNRRTIDEKQQADILNIYLSNGVLRPEEVRPIVLAGLPQIRKAMGVEDDEIFKALRGRSDTITNATQAVIKLENSFLTSLKQLLGSFANRIEERLPKLKMQDLGDKLRAIAPKFEEYVAAHSIMRFVGYRAPEAVKALPELEVLLEAIDQDRVAELLERFNLRLARRGLKVSSARSRVETPDEISVELEELIRKNSIVVAANVATSIKDSLRRELVEGLTRNETIPQIRDRIAAKLSDFVTVQVKGATDDRGRVFQGPYTRSLSRADSAEIIARTEANRAYNLGTLDALEQNDVEEVTFLLAGDACPACRAVSDSLPGTKIGKKFTLDEARAVIPVHPNCFPAHVPVFTPEGWKKISQLLAGDKVLTHRLRFRKVARTFTHEYDGPMIRLAYHRSDWRGDVACTPNHRFLTSQDEWKEARELRAGDAVLLLANRCGACEKPIP